MEKNILHGAELLEPIPNVPVSQFLLEKLYFHGDQVAQIEAITGRSFTFREIADLSLRVAACLQEKNYKKEDIIGISSENNLNFFLPLLGAVHCGMATTLFNPTYSLVELTQIMNISKPKIVFCSNLTVNIIKAAAEKLKFIKEIVLFGDNMVPGVTSFTTFLKHNIGNFKPIIKKHFDDPTLLLYSSGTTGLPKAVTLTDRNILTTYLILKDTRYGNINKEKICLALLPYFHAYGCSMQICMFAIGTKCVILPKFEPTIFLQTIEKYKISFLMLVPPLVLFLAKDPLIDRYNLSSVVDIMSGAAPMREEIQSQLSKRLNLKNIRQGYGMTEGTLAISITPPTRSKYGASGKIVPGGKCKIIDVTSGRILGPNEKGEILFSGPTVMKGYLNNIQATKETIDGENFLHTGDVGYYDKDGYLFVVDRIKELIKYKGFQVPPAELEALLLTHPLILDAAVIGLPSIDIGELPLAFVVKKPNVSLTEQEVIEFIDRQVSHHKRLRGGVRFLNSIPKTASGKILRRDLRESIKSSL